MFFLDKRAQVICDELKKEAVKQRCPVTGWVCKAGNYVTPAEADAADADADEADADAADADVDEAEAELPLAEADALPEEPLEHPTTPSASTAAKTIASSFLFTMVPSLSIGASDGPLPPDAIPLVQTRFCSRLYQDG